MPQSLASLFTLSLKITRPWQHSSLTQTGTPYTALQYLKVSHHLLVPPPALRQVPHLRQAEAVATTTLRAVLPARPAAQGVGRRMQVSLRAKGMEPSTIAYGKVPLARSVTISWSLPR